ncbi:transcriptional antiterminator [Bowmanella sp. Y26]|uniref:Tn7-like element transposition protein TnsE n=1 Tax=Bowmanella yangjiangensis TaxID=2811230 RepID=UPI001BDC29EE|nr:Tn7-like element transposition protein TnsE [Bowmanella yangjiangensis]MBT1063981.1 transcriptional antiterminator [Bowmanella yangjiangensis]
MTGSTRLKGFKDDTWINGIGELFCKKDGTQWGVNLSIYPSKERGKDASILSNAPILIRKRIINPTKDYYPRGLEKALTIATTRNWQVNVIGNCPARDRPLPKEAGQHCFVFQLSDGTTIYLPQFELARALFFHYGYLARSSVVHDLLSNEYTLEYDEENNSAVITVLETFSGNWELFNDYSFRRLLAWLLLDKEARRSYNSIGRYQLNDGYDQGQYRRWNFRFDPPELKDAMLDVRGNFDTNSQTMLIYEITSIRNIPVNIPEHVDFFSPRFFTQIPGRGSGSGSDAERPSGHNVDDAEEGSRENKPVLLSENTTVFEFKTAVETSKVSKKRKAAGRDQKDDNEPGEASRDVSTEEQGPEGNLPSAEWDNLDDQTDDTHLYLNKFASYFEMLKLLEENHGCKVIIYPLRKLPAIGKCRMHILKTDSNPRCLSVAHVTAQGIGYYLLEVDTSDAKKALSTRVILAKAVGDIEPHLHEIEKQLLKASLSWSKEHLDKLVGADNHLWVPHQQSYREGALTAGDIEKWAERMQVRLS